MRRDGAGEPVVANERAGHQTQRPLSRQRGSVVIVASIADKACTLLLAL